MGIFNDGLLGDVFGSLSNRSNGFGTSRDPLANTEVNMTPTIDELALENLYRSSRIVQKAVNLLPEDSMVNFPTMETGDDDKQFETISKSIENKLKELEVKELLCEALISSRLYGNGYLILGIDDGEERFDLPVNEKVVKGINWIKVSDTTQLLPDNPSIRGNYSHYRIINSESHSKHGDDELKTLNLIHKSRVICLKGKRLWGNAKGYNQGKDDSVVQSMFSEFTSWHTAIASSASMITSHSIFKYKLKGLSHLVKTNDKTALFNRFTTMMMGLSSMRGYILDSDGEDIDFVNRSYSGVDSILAELKESLASATDMPYTKLWGTPTGGAFSESGASDRYEWANQIDRYRSSHIEPALNRLTELLLLAEGYEIPDYHWNWENPLQLTLKEQAELRNLLADADSKNVAMGVLHPMEIRHSRFGDAEFNTNITLNEDYEMELEGKRNMISDALKIEGDVLSDEEFSDMAYISDKDKEIAIAHWKSVVSDSWVNLLEAEVRND